MEKKSNSDMLKMIGGGVIIAGACLIMFPDLLGYFGSISKLIIMILVAVLGAAFVVRAFYKIKPRGPAVKAASEQATAPSSSASDTESGT